MYYKVDRYCFWHFILFLLQITAMFLEKNQYSGFAFFWIGYKSTNTILVNLLQINNFCASLRSLIVSFFLSEKLSCICSFPLVLQNSNVKKTFKIIIQINSKSIKKTTVLFKMSLGSPFILGGFSILQEITARKPLHISHMLFQVQKVVGLWPVMWGIGEDGKLQKGMISF